MPLVEAVEEMSDAENWIERYVAELDADTVRDRARDLLDEHERRLWLIDAVARYSLGDLVLGFDAHGEPAGAMQLHEADALMSGATPLKTGWGTERLDIRQSLLYLITYAKNMAESWPGSVEDNMELFLRYCWGTPSESGLALATARQGIADGTLHSPSEDELAARERNALEQFIFGDSGMSIDEAIAQGMIGSEDEAFRLTDKGAEYARAKLGISRP